MSKIGVGDSDDDESRQINTLDKKIVNELFTETVHPSGSIKKLRIYTEISEPVRIGYTAIEPEGQEQVPSILKSEEKKYDVKEYTVNAWCNPGSSESYYDSREAAEMALAYLDDNKIALDYEIYPEDDGSVITLDDVLGKSADSDDNTMINDGSDGSMLANPLTIKERTKDDEVDFDYNINDEEDFDV